MKTVSLSRPQILIEAKPMWLSLKLRELWEYRELLYFLTWREIKVRYKQTVFGAAWAVLQPVLATVVFTLFLGRFAGIPSEGLPYALFAYCGLLPWQIFTRALTEASTSLVVNERMITKVYFPRIFVPASSVLASLADFAIAALVLIFLMGFYGYLPLFQILALPFFLSLAVMTALGVSFWLSAFDAQYRDVRYTFPFLTQFWLFASPVVYPTSVVPEPWRFFYGLNPMVCVVDGFRWALLGGDLSWATMVLSAGSAILVFWSGVVFFSSVEESIADII